MTPVAQSQKKRVFIVDDHPLVREWLTTLIDQQPDLTVCGEAATSGEARQAIAASKPEVAIVDISLKDCSGIDLIKDLTETCPRLVVLVLSMYDESHYAERALQAGARGYIMKREATKKVLEAIRSVLAGNLYLSDNMVQVIARALVEGRTIATCSPAERLSTRELAVFDLLGQGFGTRQIAQKFGLSMKTIQTYYARIGKKLNLRGLTALLRGAVRHSETKSRSDRPCP